MVKNSYKSTPYVKLLLTYNRTNPGVLPRIVVALLVGLDLFISYTVTMHRQVKL